MVLQELVYFMAFNLCFSMLDEFKVGIVNFLVFVGQVIKSDFETNLGLRRLFLVEYKS